MVPISQMKSPGVFIQEVDLSTYVAIMDTSKIFGIVTVAQNGPINQVVEINSVSKFEEVFGNPISAGGLACRFILDQTSSLKVVRVAGSSAAFRTATIAGEDAEETAVANALVISAKNKGTLFSDALKATVSAITGASADKFNLKITKGDDDEILVDKDYTIVEASATDEYPYIIADDETAFTFSLGSQTALAKLTPATVVFTVGDNGLTFTDDEVKAAIDVFDDAENIDLDILAAPGIMTASAIGRLVTVAQSRKDIVAVIDPPQGLTAEQAVQFVNGQYNPLQIQKIDSTYAACYYPWGQAYNEYSGKNEWMPPSVGVLPALAKEYATYENWTAPAGIPRMSISVFSAMERVLTRADRDIVYADGNINPLCNYKGLGLTAFGQKTMQRTLSATNRLNVRFLVNYVKRIADYTSVSYLFTEISEVTFDAWTQAIGKVLENIKVRGGLYDYKVTMDWTTVTDEMLNNNIMPGVIELKPTKTSEFIPIDVVIHNKSDEFIY